VVVSRFERPSVACEPVAARVPDLAAGSRL
jgi:hypothetical protein